MGKKKRKPSGYWIKERCATEARKHKTSSQLKKRSSGAHRAAYKNGWLDDFFSNRRKENGHWHNESNIVNAIRETKSKTPSEFEKKCRGGYKGMLRLGLREKLFPEGKPYGKWNKIENIKKEIIRTKSETRTEFKERSVGAYEGALRNNWDRKLFKKMKRRGSPKKRGIYVFEFTDGSVYVGLTDKMPRRKYEHLNSSSNKHVKEKLREGISYKFKILTPCILTNEQAVDKENHYLNKYRKKGCEILNIAKPGSLGGNIVRLTEAVCAAEAKKYNHRGDFQKNSFSEYKAAWSGGFLDKICAHMTKKKIESKWTYERCADEAKKYKTRTEFQKGSSGAYNAAYKNKWLPDICGHMISSQKPHGYWSKERCAAEAKKYKYRGDFQKHSPSAYVIALRNGWLDEICKHMKKKVKK